MPGIISIRHRKLLVTGFFLMATVCLLWAAGPDPSETPAVDRPHAPMEFFGIGPELFQDRGVAWAKAIGTVLGEGISQFGILVLALLLLKKNITNQELKERIDRTDNRATAALLAADPNAAPVTEIDRPTVVSPAPEHS